MAMVPVTLPPGFYANGTPYGVANRWNGGNLVRFHNDSLRPIGGWVRREDASGVVLDAVVLDAADETVRDGITYRTNDGAALAVFGHNAGLTQINSLGVVTDWRTGFIGGANDVTQLIGYGMGPYGAGPYGTPRNPADVKPVPVARWSFDMWGENVLAAYEGGSIYEILPDFTVAVLANAPTTVQDMIVTDERIVMAITNDPEIRTVIWSDREDNDDWTPTQTNYAGSRVLTGEGLLLGIYKIQSQILILSETDAHIGTYINAPFVYGFRRIGEKCPPIHRAAVVAADRFIIWLGEQNFWVYDGTVRPLPCSIMDHIARTLDTQQVSKIHTCTIAEFNEVWWFYQSIGGSEVDSYVAYNYVTGVWVYGSLNRVCAIDSGAYRSAIMIDPSGLVYNHEQAGVIPNGTMFAQTGPLEIMDGDKNMPIRYVFPDTETKGDVSYEFFARQMPTEPDYSFGPYTYNNPISTTGLMGREIRMKVTGITNDWEVGNKTRFDIADIGGGKR